MQFSVILAAALNLAGAAFALPAPLTASSTVSVPTSTITSAPACKTTFTVTSDYADGIITSYEAYAAVPWDLICNGCELESTTKWINIPPSVTATAPTSTTTVTGWTLLHIPLCTELPTAEPMA
ncbi:hypothetical protein ABW21_db0202962 [Orbilia brochopaga]|nr:hypothetical protein ABW21_db0202962 [Drechslerella brochopaga]